MWSIGISLPMGVLGPSVWAGSAPRLNVHAARSLAAVASSAGRVTPASAAAPPPELELEQATGPSDPNAQATMTKMPAAPAD